MADITRTIKTIYDMEARVTGSPAMVRLATETAKLRAEQVKSEATALRLAAANDRLRLSNERSSRVVTQARGSFGQFGAQINDVAVQIGNGQSVLVAFANQVSQIGFAAQAAGGRFAGFGRFLLSGPGAAITVVLSLLPALVKAFEGTRKVNDDLRVSLGLTVEEFENFNNKSVTFTDYAVGFGKQLYEQFGLVRTVVDGLVTAYEALGQAIKFIGTNVIAPFFIGQLALIRQMTLRLEAFARKVGQISRFEFGPNQTQIEDFSTSYETVANEVGSLVSGTRSKANERQLARARAEAAAIIAERSKLSQAANDNAAAVGREAEVLNELREKYLKLYDPMYQLVEIQNELAQTTDELNKLRDAGLIKSELYNAALVNAQERAAALTAEFGELWDSADPDVIEVTGKIDLLTKYLKNTQEEAKRLALEWEKAAFPIQQFADQFGQAVTDVIFGAQSIKDAIRDMVEFVLKELAKVAIRNFVSSLFAGGAAKGAAFDANGATPNAKGNVFGTAQKFAVGGIVNRPTNFAFMNGGVPALGLLGEAGPEAILPLSRGRDGKLGVKSGGLNVQIFNNNGSQVTTEQRDDGSLAVFIEHARRTVATDIARGGTLISSAMERTYGVGRNVR